MTPTSWKTKNRGNLSVALRARIHHIIKKLKWHIVDHVIVAWLVGLLSLVPDQFHVRAVSRNQRVRKLDYEKTPLWFEVQSIFQLSRLKSCEKEPGTVAWLERELKDGCIYYDIGANVGAYALIAGTLVGKSGLVYAFEPSFFNYAAIVRNIIINNMSDKVIALPVALGSRTALTTFNFSSTDVGSAEHALGNSTNMYGEGFVPVAKQSVIAASLDWFVESYNLRYPTHIKLDVDGIEQEVLEGMEMLLGLNTVVGILVEVREGSKEENSIMAMLCKHGFDYEQKGYATTPGFANLIFSRQKSL